MPTLLDNGSFSYDSRANTTEAQRLSAERDRAIDIIVNILNTKLRSPGRCNRLYYLRGRTGSGKSTLMISTLYERVTKGTNGALWCTEPRVVLTRSNPTDIMRYNTQYSFGKQIGILSGSEKIKCDTRECMYFCTPQILNDELLRILSLDDGKSELTKLRLVVIDEVHVLDNPMLQLLKTIRDLLNKYDTLPECPLFVFASATINIEKLVEYYNDKPDMIYKDPLMIGEVKGSSNFPVDEHFLTSSELQQFNNRESQSTNRLEGFRIMAEYFVKNYLNGLLTDDNIKGGSVDEYIVNENIDEKLLNESLIKNTVNDQLIENIHNEYIVENLPNEYLDDAFINNPVNKYIHSHIAVNNKNKHKQTNNSIITIPDAYITTPIGKVRCRDVLFFVPLVAGIEEIGKCIQHSIKDVPVMIITKDMSFDEVTKWRSSLKSRKRILFIPFARDYAPASDVLLADPLEKDPDALLHEIRIIAATPVIETGKTISTLCLCIDMGLNTTAIANPLSYNPNDALKYLKQIPANVNQTIQRMGRVGREAAGIYLHFYSRDIYKRFQLTDTAETINTQCLSGMMMDHLKIKPKNMCYDIINENVWLYPTSIDVLIRTSTDLIQAGYLLPYGQYVELRSNSKYSSNWIMYAKMLVVRYRMSLFDALLISAINWKAIPGLFNINDINPERLKFNIKNIIERFKNINSSDEYYEYIGNLPPEVYDGIYKARNILTEILYGKDKSFPVNMNRIY